MRRQDLVLSLYDSEHKPYGVPLEYVRKGNALYFHGAKEGRKVTAMQAKLFT